MAASVQLRRILVSPVVVSSRVPGPVGIQTKGRTEAKDTPAGSPRELPTIGRFAGV
jgi:hypothetical protein